MGTQKEKVVLVFAFSYERGIVAMTENSSMHEASAAVAMVHALGLHGVAIPVWADGATELDAAIARERAAIEELIPR